MGLLAAMWFFSGQDAADSMKVSNSIVDRIAQLIYKNPTAEQLSLLSHIVRKGAHFNEFALLGICAAALLLTPGHLYTGLFALPFATLCAMADEYHQRYSPGRGPLWSDVLLDSCGALFGITVLLLLCLIWRKKMYKPVKNRGMWTWGHVIYDYRGYITHMRELGLNTIIIWNDIAPLNAREVLEFAHQNGVKVIWGFAWGWLNNCNKVLESLDDETLTRLKSEVVREFSRDYRDIAPDGIYFQSFTEVGYDMVNGRSIAAVVTDFVNSVARMLLWLHPGLEIQFGLHAASVREHLDEIARVDPRIRIVWENCGAFPFADDPDNTENYAETLEFVKKITRLRGKHERCGFVFKGMTKLDWSKFEYHTEAYNVGEAPKELILEKQAALEPRWEYVSRCWHKNRALAEEMLEVITDASEDSLVTVLLEDGCFENEIKPAARIFAELTGAK